MLVIINVNRFGMTQLDKLRGHIGRRNKQASYILLASSKNVLQERQFINVKMLAMWVLIKNLKDKLQI
jgi:RecG-like helicase